MVILSKWIEIRGSQPDFHTQRMQSNQWSIPPAAQRKPNPTSYGQIRPQQPHQVTPCKRVWLDARHHCQSQTAAAGMVAPWLLLDEGMKFPWAGGDARSTASICWQQSSCPTLPRLTAHSYSPQPIPTVPEPPHRWGWEGARLGSFACQQLQRRVLRTCVHPCTWMGFPSWLCQADGSRPERQPDATRSRSAKRKLPIHTGPLRIPPHVAATGVRL